LKQYSIAIALMCFVSGLWLIRPCFQHRAEQDVVLLVRSTWHF